MKPIYFFSLFICLCLLLTGCSNTNDTESSETVDNNVFTENELTETMLETVEDEKEVPETPQVTEACAALTGGWNRGFIVNGKESDNLEREFILELPESVDDKRGWPVIFSWHGVGDTAENFQYLLKNYVNNEAMPFILVTPEDENLPIMSMPPQGVDWDNLVLENGSIEVELFDAVLECIDQKWGVNWDHVHLTGFSAGSITADSIATFRGEIIASVFTYSGAYFTNPLNIEDLGEAFGQPVGNFISWPDPTHENRYTQILLHGAEGDAECEGPTACDKWGASGMFTINFNHMSRFDADYLTENGHQVIICNHGKGHTNAGLNPTQMIQFFSDHPLGTTDSPYADKLPSGYPEGLCEFRK